MIVLLVLGLIVLSPLLLVVLMGGMGLIFLGLSISPVVGAFGLLGWSVFTFGQSMRGGGRGAPAGHP